MSIKGEQEFDDIVICNQLGQTIMQKKYNTNETLVDLSMLNSGIYFVTITSDKKQSTYKIVKQ